MSSVSANEMITLSLVIPVYSGEDYLEKLVEAIADTNADWKAKGLPVSILEAVFVDDSAIDKSPEILDLLAAKHDWVHVYHMARNYGQHGATVAGIRQTKGDWVASLDEDLQHPPARLLDMLIKAVSEAKDVVYARPTEAVHNSLFRDLSSRGIKLLFEKLTNNPYMKLANSFRLIRGDIARGASSSPSYDTYFDVALYWYTNRIAGLEMPLRDDRYQATGKSGYSFKSLIKHARRMIVSSDMRVFRMATILSTGFVLFAMLWAIYVFIKASFFPGAFDGADGWPSLMIAILTTSGIGLLILILMLENISLLAQKAHGRPDFFFVDRSADNQLKSFLEAEKTLLADYRKTYSA